MSLVKPTKSITIQYDQKVHYSKIKETLFVPKEAYDLYKSLQKNPFAPPLEGKDLVDAFKAQGAVLSGKNALVRLDTLGHLQENDYYEDGQIQERRTYNKHGKLNWRLLYNKENEKTVEHRIDSANLVRIYSNVSEEIGCGDSYPLWVTFEHKNTLKMRDVNGYKSYALSAKGQELNENIRTILASPNDVSEALQSLTDIILPLQETVNLYKQEAVNLKKVFKR